MPRHTITFAYGESALVHTGKRMNQVTSQSLLDRSIRARCCSCGKLNITQQSWPSIAPKQRRNLEQHTAQSASYLFRQSPCVTNLSVDSDWNSIICVAKRGLLRVFPAKLETVHLLFITRWAVPSEQCRLMSGRLFSVHWPVCLPRLCFQCHRPGPEGSASDVLVHYPAFHSGDLAGGTFLLYSGARSLLYSGEVQCVPASSAAGAFAFLLRHRDPRESGRQRHALEIHAVAPPVRQSFVLHAALYRTIRCSFALAVCPPPAVPLSARVHAATCSATASNLWQNPCSSAAVAMLPDHAID